MRKNYGAGVVGGGMANFGSAVPARMASKKIYKLHAVDTSGALNFVTIQILEADGLTVVSTLYFNIIGNGEATYGHPNGEKPFIEIGPGQQIQANGTGGYSLSMEYEYI